VRGTYVVDGSGNITLAAPVTGNWVAGLPYRMRYKSARLAYGAEGGTAMLARKEVNTIGAIMTDFTRQGVKHGMSFDKMYRLPEKGSGKTLSNIVTDVEDIVPFSAGGGWSLDSRVHLEVNSPYTATFCGVVLDITTSG
jgi:hypothetical protein